METTLNEIRKHHPCGLEAGCNKGFDRLLTFLGKTQPDDEPVSLKQILESNGIEDAIWCLRCFDYLDYCLSLADVAEIVLPIFEARNKHDDRPRKAIEAIRKYEKGEITEDELRVAEADARTAAYSTAYAAAYAAYAARTAASAAYSAAYSTAYSTAHAASSAASAASAYGAAYSTAHDAAYAAKENKWNEIETIFIKHFCQK